MKVTVTTDKTKVGFKPIEVNLKIVLEKQSEVDEFKDMVKAYDKGNLTPIQDDYEGNDFELMTDVAIKIAEKL